jgi:hypothetical protein
VAAAREREELNQKAREREAEERKEEEERAVRMRAEEQAANGGGEAAESDAAFAA